MFTQLYNFFTNIKLKLCVFDILHTILCLYMNKLEICEKLTDAATKIAFGKSTRQKCHRIARKTWLFIIAIFIIF
jgi:hypothetical protein